MVSKIVGVKMKKAAAPASPVEATVTAPPAPRAKTALEVWHTPIAWPSFEMAKTSKATLADQLGAPGSVSGSQFQTLRAVRIATWLRMQTNQDYRAIDEQLFKLRSASARASQPEPGTKAYNLANEAFENTLGQVVADIEGRLVKHFGAVPEVPAPAKPEPTPAPVAAPTAMTAEDAVKVRSTIFALHMAGVAFSVDLVSNSLKYYDARKVMQPEDRLILHTFPAEAKRVVVETYLMNSPSVPDGDCTRVIA
jgi:hypothetical protein